MDYLTLPDKKCKKCKHLDSQERTAYKCIDLPECPAKEVQIVVQSKVKDFVKQYKAALYEGDLIKQKQVIESVLKESASFRQEFSELVLKKD